MNDIIASLLGYVCTVQTTDGKERKGSLREMTSDDRFVFFEECDEEKVSEHYDAWLNVDHIVAINR